MYAWTHPPPPTPPHRFAEGGEKSGGSPHSIPPASAKNPRASCRRRSARSAARNDPRTPFPVVPIDAPAATSRARRTSAERFRVTAHGKKGLLGLRSRLYIKPWKQPQQDPARERCFRYETTGPRIVPASGPPPQVR